ncbi:MAG TPA: xanthine dehydrogenase family protein subunit M [Nitrososphaerales archaeon]|nr:xanthine dehydrogenase family protein subunit M [Nitrososphaerales archaeon]
MRSFQYLAPIPPFDYASPRTLPELFETLEGHGKELQVIAGGTDLMIALKERAVAPKIIVDLSRLRKELGGITVEGGVLRIGALATFSQIESSPLVARYANALRQAAANVGTLQIRSIATLGGNLATASPAADSAPPLIALGATVTLLSRSEQRSLAVQNVFAGPKRNGLRPGEIVSSVEIPANEEVRSAWTRSAVRNENVLSTVSVAVAATLQDGRFGPSGIALGAVAPTPILAEKASREMTGSRATKEQAERVASMAAEDARPISDIRASAHYRKRLVLVLTKRLILQILSESVTP